MNIQLLQEVSSREHSVQLKGIVQNKCRSIKSLIRTENAIQWDEWLLYSGCHAWPTFQTLMVWKWQQQNKIQIIAKIKKRKKKHSPSLSRDDGTTLECPAKKIKMLFTFMGESETINEDLNDDTIAT